MAIIAIGFIAICIVLGITESLAPGAIGSFIKAAVVVGIILALLVLCPGITIGVGVILVGVACFT